MFQNLYTGDSLLGKIQREAPSSRGERAESRRKVESSRLDFAVRRLEYSLFQPSSEWVPFSNQGRIRQQKERDGLCFH